MTRSHGSTVVDRAGMLISGLCALHCLLTPLLLGVVSTFGAFWSVWASVETIVIGVALLLGLTSLVPGYLRHRNRMPLDLFAMGFVFVAASRLIPAGPLHSICAVGLAMGGSLIATAHFLNSKHLMKRRHVACPTFAIMGSSTHHRCRTNLEA